MPDTEIVADVLREWVEHAIDLDTQIAALKAARKQHNESGTSDGIDVRVANGLVKLHFMTEKQKARRRQERETEEVYQLALGLEEPSENAAVIRRGRRALANAGESVSA